MSAAVAPAAAPPRRNTQDGVPTRGGGSGARARRAWDAFDSWFRGVYDRSGHRPKKALIAGWYEQHAPLVWGAAERPSLQEARDRAKGLGRALLSGREAGAGGARGHRYPLRSHRGSAGGRRGVAATAPMAAFGDSSGATSSDGGGGEGGDSGPRARPGPRPRRGGDDAVEPQPPAPPPPSSPCQPQPSAAAVAAAAAAAAMSAAAVASAQQHQQQLLSGLVMASPGASGLGAAGGQGPSSSAACTPAPQHNPHHAARPSTQQQGALQTAHPHVPQHPPALQSAAAAALAAAAAASGSGTPLSAAQSRGAPCGSEEWCEWEEEPIGMDIFMSSHMHRE
ncbi:MAG: hypothetical protein J3K34DRAFT_517307 [Monoraphidium minutum]|nr:MAG: hypothetical protein J3K34DRAFT_517307 [Monoraphidium minutum]